MADDSNPPPTGPLANLITEARNGNLTVSFGQGVGTEFRLNADEFAYIERDCKAFKEEIRKLQQHTKLISQLPNWGLGETADGLTSAKTVVPRFRSKAQKAGLPTDTDDNIHDILDQHYKIIDDLQTLHHVIAQRYCEQDSHFATEYNRIMADIEPSPIGTPMQLGVTGPGLGQSK